MGPFTSLPYVEQSYQFFARFPPEDPTGDPQVDSSQQREESLLRVLVVDDDMRIADTTAEVLKLAGFEAMAAYNGDSALDIAARFRPDCLLSDVVMTGMNGVELATAIRQKHPHTRVVLMSGQAGISEILDQAEEQGLEFQVLGKPIHPRNLIQELRKPEPDR
jgi:DNA-binding NtrC family response regulator